MAVPQHLEHKQDMYYVAQRTATVRCIDAVKLPDGIGIVHPFALAVD
jgi:hypothetical protein